MSSIDLFAPSSETRRLSVNLTAEQLEKIGMPTEEANDFIRLRNRFLEKPLVEWDKVEPPPEEFLKDYETLPEPSPERTKEILDKLVVVQLNGGLGTNMGLKGTKSGLHVLTKDTHGVHTILDCKVLQIDKLNATYGCDIPLVLMNSPNTHAETLKMIRKYEAAKVKIHTFCQSEHPLMHKDTLAPVPKSKNDREYWIPPGSGEVFRGLMRSGLLEQFRQQGKEFLFVSNVENLGSGIDLRLLDHIASGDIDFQLELTNRISTDAHGGFPIFYKDTKIHIMEMSQVPFTQHKDFGIAHYKYWNTNNMWVKLNNVWNMLKLGAIDLDFIIKYRLLNGRNLAQVETPAAMSIHSFKRAVGVKVPRSRYLPLKTTAHLLAAQSELYEFKDGSFIMNPKRVPATSPLIKLGDSFTTLQEYEKRFRSLPNIIELDHLTVSGDVFFGSNVTLKGTVIIVADHGSRIDIPDGVVLENKIVSGGMQVRDN